ncbi:MAG: ParB/RepB/Spo0J family partition protein [Planctomycetota bacterium]
MAEIKKRTLLQVSPSDISPNPHNPRMIFDEEELKELKDSIEKVGILVPLTIYENKKSFPKTKYVLLDGERRWRCAQQLNLKLVPANIIDEPEDVTQNILFMFNIHHFRREWALFPTALKLDVLIKKLKTDNDATLSNFTGVNKSMVRRCKMLLWFPEKYRNTLMAKSSKISTDFFIEIYAVAYRLGHEDEFRYPDKIEVFIDACKDKFLNALITDVKEFRDMRKCMAYYESIDKFNDFKSKISKFIREKDIGLEIFAVQDIEQDRTRKNIIKYISYLNENLETINPDIINDAYLVDQLKKLKNNLKRIIEHID